MQKINVLMLVEDDENDILLTERRIQRANLPLGEFVVARSLADARRVLQAKAIDVVLLDLNLSDSRGLDTLRSLRPAFDGVLIVLTSLDDENIGIQAIRIGADDYLVKARLTDLSLRHSIAFAGTRHLMKQTARRMNETIDTLAAMSANR